MITKDSVERTLDKIYTKLKENNKQLKIYEEMNSELIKLRSLLGLQDNEPVLSNELEALIKNAKQQTGKDKMDEEWESWARRVYTLISDYSSTAQTAKELQFALEEALLGNIGQRLMTRRLGTLRTEKQILLTGLLANMNKKENDFENRMNRDRKGRYSLSSKSRDLKASLSSQDKNKMISIRHILIMLSCIRRMQKISGHIKCSIISPKRKIERNDNEEINLNSQRDKGYPILNSND